MVRNADDARHACTRVGRMLTGLFLAALASMLFNVVVVRRTASSPALA
jgi:hypothetical protein